jgi:hypothetical protein
VSPTVVLLSLLAPTGPGAAHAPEPPPCQTFSRSTQTMPAVVRAWFAHSADQRVVMCPQNAAATGESAAPLYFGEDAVSRQGAVCSYRSHGLTLTGSGDAARLQRYERSEAVDMTLASPVCPIPHAPGTVPYVETYDITAASFEQIMRLWSAAAAAAAGEANAQCCARHPDGDKGSGSAHGQPAHLSIAPEVREHLEAALGPDHLLTPTVTRIVRIPGSMLRHRYALSLAVTDTAAASTALYVVYVDKTVRGPYEITAFAETN